jgi:hypothetical protein
MKKILPFFLFLLMSVTAMAGVTHEYEDTYRCVGDMTCPKGTDGSGKVVITDNEDGTYDIQLSGLYVYVDLGTITFKGVPGTTENNITTLSSDMNFVDAEVVGSGFNRGATSMTVEGQFNDDECYLYLEGQFQGWSDNPFMITFGSKIELPATVYNVPAKVTYGDVTVSHDSDEIRITNNGDGTIKFAYMKFTIAESNILIADYAVDQIPVGDTDEEGYTSFATTSDNVAKASNISSFAASSGIAAELDLPVTVSGRFNDTNVEAKGEFKISGSGTAPTASFVVGSTATAISSIEASNAAVEGIYTATGVKCNQLQKGFNIIRKGGKAYKVMYK